MLRRWRLADDVIGRRLPQGVLVLALGAGEPLEISGPGGDLWDQLRTPVTTDELVKALAERYVTDEDEVRRDLEPLLDDLLARRVLSVEETA